MITLLEKFIQSIQTDKSLELYNEASLQHELGFFLKREFPNAKIQLERNVEAVFGHKSGFSKKEIDIYIESKGKKYAIEIKLPVNKQVPRRMELAIADLRFLEELKTAGFDGCYFLFVTHVKSFWDSRRDQVIYEMFNDGHIRSLTPDHVPDFIKSSTSAFKPLKNEYEFDWLDLTKRGGYNWRYFLIEI